MDDKKIKELFERLSKECPEATAESQDIFKILVEATLEYRDFLVSKGDKLTVEEVQTALDELLLFFKQNKLSKNIKPKQLDLVTRWIYAVSPQPKH